MLCATTFTRSAPSRSTASASARARSATLAVAGSATHRTGTPADARSSSTPSK
jgi:hypothetical protein